jgi:hypothetical protein
MPLASEATNFMHSFLRITRFQSKTNITSKIGLRKGLNEVSENSFIQGARPDTIIRVGSDEDCWDSATLLDQMFMELNAGHAGHVTSAIRQEVSSS